ncbi:hypothetical protein J6590_071226 [Homalodisca vitripennis]|nr:hypothetical protein J6590_071226 [Homalodisca vitripennis]
MLVELIMTYRVWRAKGRCICEHRADLERDLEGGISPTPYPCHPPILSRDAKMDAKIWTTAHCNRPNDVFGLVVSQDDCSDTTYAESPSGPIIVGGCLFDRMHFTVYKISSGLRWSGPVAVGAPRFLPPNYGLVQDLNNVYVKAMESLDKRLVSVQEQGLVLYRTLEYYRTHPDKVQDWARQQALLLAALRDKTAVWWCEAKSAAAGTPTTKATKTDKTAQLSPFDKLKKAIEALKAKLQKKVDEKQKAVSEKKK